MSLPPLYENSYESLHPWKYVWKCLSMKICMKDFMHIKGWCCHPSTMHGSFIRQVVAYHTARFAVARHPLPTPDIKLESTDNPSNVVHTIPSTLRTLGVHNLTLKIAHCILHTEHFIQQCMIVKNVCQFCTISIYCDCLQHVNWTVAWSNCSICCKFILYLQYVCVDQTARAIKVI